MLNQIDPIFTRNINHWQTGDQAIREEILRLVRKAIKRGQNAANVDLKDIILKLEVYSHNDASFHFNVDKQLKKLAKQREAADHPYKLLPDEFVLEGLAELFALYHLNKALADDVIEEIKLLELYENRIIQLSDGIAKWALKQKLSSFLEMTYSEWHEIKSDAKILLGTLNLKTKTTHLINGEIVEAPEIVFSNTHYPPQELIKISKKRESKSEKLENKLNGFPWMNKLSDIAHNKIMMYFINEKLFDENFDIKEFRALFSETGPSKPIRIIESPGKLVLIFKWLFENDVLRKPLDYPLNEDTNRLGSWLNPRLVGTFRNKDGIRYKRRQLTRAASNLKFNQIEGTTWYKEMELFFSKNTKEI